VAVWEEPGEVGLLERNGHVESTVSEEDVILYLGLPECDVISY
jgi:hypothetical protein